MDLDKSISYCSECSGAEIPKVLIKGYGEYGYEGEALICQSCLEKALELIKQEK